MNRKESIPKRKSSLGLRGLVNATMTMNIPDDRSRDGPSTSRNQTLQPFSSMTSRIPRISSTRDNRRSSSQEPPVRRHLQMSPGQFMHMKDVGTLLTPVRPTPSRSPSLLSMASSTRNSSVRRQSSMKYQLAGAATKMKDERQVGDKIFQAESLSRIQIFLRNAGIQPPCLKPMSNSSLILAFNTIIGHIDSTIKVQSVDYVEKIPYYLRQLRYPFAITKSSFMAVGCSSATNQLIAMLAWLVDSVDCLTKKNVEEIVFGDVAEEDTKQSMAFLKSLMIGYTEFVENKVETTPERFQDLLCQELGDSRDEEYQLLGEIEDLEKQLASLNEDPHRKETDDKVRVLDEAEEKVHQLKVQYNQLSRSVATQRAKNQEETQNIKQLDTDLSRLDDHIAEIQEKVDNQEMRPVERDAIQAECAQLRELTEQHAAYFEKLQNSIGKIDIEMANHRKRIGDITQDMNCLVLENGLDENLKWSVNPLQCEDVEARVQQLRQRWEKALQAMNKDLEASKAELVQERKEVTKLQDELLEKQKMIKQYTEDMRRLDAEIVTGQINTKTQEEKLQADIEEQKALCIRLRQLLDKKPKLEIIEAKIKAILDEKAKVQEEHEKFKNLTENVSLPTAVKLSKEMQNNTLKATTKIIMEGKRKNNKKK